jgi:hypothetical protein
VHNGYIVYHSFRDNVCHLNSTAAISFELRDGKLDKEEVVACVAKIFDVAPTEKQIIGVLKGARAGGKDLGPVPEARHRRGDLL